METGGGLALDHVNYDDASEEWCPLAVAVGLPGIFDRDRRRPSNMVVTAMLAMLGLRVNNTRNVPDEFYRGARRREDLRTVVDELLTEAV